MDTFDRNVAIIGSAVYGGLLLIGMLLFALGHRGEPFYGHPSANVAIFSVFWFSFSPSLLFMGATVPWLCALCESRAAALTFAVVPGGLFILVGAYWIMLNDRHQNFTHPLDVTRASPWQRNAWDVAYPPSAALYRVGESVEHFPSPADVAEMTRRGGGLYASPSPTGWLPGGGGDGGIGLPAFSTTAAAPYSVRGSSTWSPHVTPQGFPPVLSPAHGPGALGHTPAHVWPNTDATSAAAAAAAASRMYYGGGGGSGAVRGPQLTYVDSPPPMAMHPPVREHRPSAYYIA